MHPVSQVLIRYLCKTNIIVFANLSTIKQAKCHLSTTIIARELAYLAVIHSSVDEQSWQCTSDEE